MGVKLARTIILPWRTTPLGNPGRMKPTNNRKNMPLCTKNLDIPIYRIITIHTVGMEEFSVAKRYHMFYSMLLFSVSGRIDHIALHTVHSVRFVSVHRKGLATFVYSLWIFDILFLLFRKRIQDGEQFLIGSACLTREVRDVKLFE